MTNGFYCVPSIVEALNFLSVEEQKEAAWAVLRYGGFGEIRQDIGNSAKLLLTMAMPNIDAAVRRQQERSEEQAMRKKKRFERKSEKRFQNEKSRSAEEVKKYLPGDPNNFDSL